jgi:hypothetical protein
LAGQKARGAALLVVVMKPSPKKWPDNSENAAMGKAPPHRRP